MACHLACLLSHGMYLSRSGFETLSNGVLHASCSMSGCPLEYMIPYSTSVASVQVFSAGSEAASGSFNTKVSQLRPFTPFNGCSCFACARDPVMPKAAGLPVAARQNPAQGLSCCGAASSFVVFL